MFGAALFSAPLLKDYGSVQDARVCLYPLDGPLLSDATDVFRAKCTLIPSVSSLWLSQMGPPLWILLGGACPQGLHSASKITVVTSACWVCGSPVGGSSSWKLKRETKSSSFPSPGLFWIFAGRLGQVGNLQIDTFFPPSSLIFFFFLKSL